MAIQLTYKISVLRKKISLIVRYDVSVKTIKIPKLPSSIHSKQYLLNAVYKQLKFFQA